MAARAKGNGVSDQWVDAGPFRAQLRFLMASGSLTVDDVAAVAGISARLADRLLHGRDGRPLRRISPDTARRLIQISDQQVRRCVGSWCPPPLPGSNCVASVARAWGFRDRGAAKRRSS